MAITEGLAAYREKLQNGQIKRSPPKDPIQKAKENPRSLRLAINAKCFDCCCEQRAEVTHCTAVGCPLYLLRPWQLKNKKDK